jgi:hypothetical protein
MMPPLSRRTFLQFSALAGSAFLLRPPLGLTGWSDPDSERLTTWAGRIRMEGLTTGGLPPGAATARTGELACGTPYEAGALEAYLRAGGDPRQREPLTLSLTRFDCVTLVESCLAVARVAAATETPSWAEFGAAIERMRYRGGVRESYTSRLHYFSEWISDGADRGLVRDLGGKLGGVDDARPLRFMSEHRASYPALQDDGVYAEIASMEQRLDARPRCIIPTARIAEVSSEISTGDILAFATEIPGLDVTHAALAHRGEDGILHVLHAPLSGGVVQLTRTTLTEYVSAIRRATGVMVARPL